MEIEKTEKLLNKFDYQFARKKDKLIIQLDLAQRIIVDFSDHEKIKITDKLVGWNFLTGLIEMTLKSATIFNFIGALVWTFILTYLDSGLDGLNLLFFFLTYIVWILLWTTFYSIKAENMKRTIITWNQ